MMKKIALGLVTLFGITSCSQQNNMKDLTDITSRIDKSSGFIDLTLVITDKKETDSTFIYKAEGLYKSDTVGIQISLKKGLKAGIVNGEMKNVFAQAIISFNSIGSKSDRLLNAMTELYQIDSINNSMCNELLTFTCANLNDKDINYSVGEYKFKIFMESEEDNSELFVDFDFSNGQIYFNEKDPEYRKGILTYLMKK